MPTTMLNLLYAVLCIQPSHDRRPRPYLTDLPDDVLLHIVDALASDSSALNALAQTCRAFNMLSTPVLYRAVRSPAHALRRTLLVRPDLALHVRTMHVDVDGRNSSKIAPTRLAHVLRLTPRLRTLVINAPIDPSASYDELQSALTNLTELHHLELVDATRQTMRAFLLAHLGHLKTLRVHAWPSALPSSVRPPADLACALVSCLERSAGLRTLETDAALLASMNVNNAITNLTVHGSCSNLQLNATFPCAASVVTCESPCEGCAPAGAAWEARDAPVVPHVKSAHNSGRGLVSRVLARLLAGWYAVGR